MEGRQEEKGRRSKTQNPAWHSGHYYFVVKGPQPVTLHLFNSLPSNSFCPLPESFMDNHTELTPRVTRTLRLS